MASRFTLNPEAILQNAFTLYFNPEAISQNALALYFKTRIPHKSRHPPVIFQKSPIKKSGTAMIPQLHPFQIPAASQARS
ncbi:hypothetical protein [Clostridium sp. MCC353]|uniref:hypothetical protein n=1 Tax=Clostridium sp. MCC353 TaxID=2592646 RepID=UPI001C022021|nr:hypothetical protein [Clostridium sp. MCC353]